MADTYYAPKGGVATSPGERRMNESGIESPATPQRSWWDKFFNGADAPAVPTLAGAPQTQNTPVQQVLQALATSVPQGYTVAQAPTLQNALQAQAAQAGSYSDADYQAKEAAALDYIKSQLGFSSGAQEAADAYYGQGKKALDKSLAEQKAFNESDAARRGLFNSGVLTDNQNKAYEGYQKGLGDLGAQTAQYKQQMSAADQAVRQNAAQAIMGYKPASYAQWQQQNQNNAEAAGWQNQNNQAWQQGNLNAALQGWAAQNAANAQQWGAQNDAASAYAQMQNQFNQNAANQNNANSMAQWQAAQEAAMQQWLLQQQLLGNQYGEELKNWQNKKTPFASVMDTIGGLLGLGIKGGWIGNKG